LLPARYSSVEASMQRQLQSPSLDDVSPPFPSAVGTVLSGHLNCIQAIQAISDTMQLLTCASDGLILTWGLKAAASMAGNNKRKGLAVKRIETRGR
jgi:hypothetical protein